MKAVDEDEVRAQLVALLPRLRRFARALCGTLDDGDDLVQAACERALSRLDQWAPGTRLDSWMFRIMKNLHIDDGRKRQHQGPSVDSSLADLVIGTDGERVIEAKLTLASVGEAMANLPEQQRTILTLVCIEELPYREVARVLDVPMGTVMSRLARARRALHASVYDPRSEP